MDYICDYNKDHEVSLLIWLSKKRVGFTKNEASEIIIIIIIEFVLLRNESYSCNIKSNGKKLVKK